MMIVPSEKSHTPTSEIKKGTETFTANVFTLSGGAILAIGVTLLAAPITSRLFGPEEFGLAEIFRTGVAILGAIACLRYEMAIVLPKKDEDAAPIFVLCFITLLATTTLTTIITMLFGARVLTYLDAVELKPLLWVFPIFMFLIGARILLNKWYIRHKRFKISATGGILASLFRSVFEIGGGLVGFRTGGNLVVLRVFGMTISPAYFLLHISGEETRIIVRNINLGAILESAKRYIKFPLYDSLATLLQVLSMRIPIILLIAFFSPAVGGLFTKAFYLLQLPGLILGQAVGQVFLQESAIFVAEGRNLAGLVDVVSNRMTTVGLLAFAVLSIIAPELFGLFLGARWIEAGVYAQIMMPWLFISFITGSIMTLFGTLGRQELNLTTTASLMVLRVSIIVWGGLVLRDARLTILILTMASTLVLFWRFFLLIRTAGLPARVPFLHFIRCSVYAIPSVILIATMKWWFCLKETYLIMLVPILCIPYVVLVLHHDHELRDLSAKILRRVYSFF